MWQWNETGPTTHYDSSDGATGQQQRSTELESFPASLADALFRGTSERPQITFSSDQQKREYEVWFRQANERLRHRIQGKERIDLLEAV
jgi:hypothetical protein